MIDSKQSGRVVMLPRHGEKKWDYQEFSTKDPGYRNYEYDHSRKEIERSLRLDRQGS